MFATLASAVICGAATAAISRYIATAMPVVGSPTHAEPISEAIGFWMMTSVAFTLVLSPIVALVSWARLNVSRSVVATMCAVGAPLMMLAFFSRDDGIINGMLLNIGHWFERPGFFLMEYAPVAVGAAVFGYVAAGALKKPSK